MVKLVLRLFDALAWPLRALGVSYPQFRAILEVKLTLDTRRRMVMTVRRGRQKKPANAFAGTLVFYAFLGMFIGLTVVAAGPPLAGMTIVQAFIMTMVGLSLVADFSSVLLDTTDNAILQPRPVDGRTILAARIAHIVAYLASLSLSLGLGTLIAGTYRWGSAFAPVFILTLACAVSLVVCVVNLFYLAAIRLTDREKLRDIILYVQIIMSLVVVGGYQLLPYLVDIRELKDLRIDDRWWIYLVPPAWMAAPIDLLAGNTGRPQLILTAMAVGLPLLGMVAVLRVLGPRFSHALAMMDVVSASNSHPPAAARGHRPVQRLARLLCRTHTGQSVFEFVWLLCSRDRQFKLRTYPSLAIIFILPVFWIVSGHASLREALADLPSTKKYLIVLYMSCAMLPSALIQLRFSDNWQAAWVYGALPIALPGEVFAAAMKALIVRFVLPAFAAVSAVTLAFWGPAIISDIVLAGCSTLLLCTLYALLFGRRFPFAEAFGVADASGRMAKSLLLMALPAALGGLHYLLTFWPLLVPMAIPVVLLAAAGLFRFYARTSWAAVNE